MTINDVQTVLYRCQTLRQEIESYEERIARLRSEMEGATSRLLQVPGNETLKHDKLASQIARLEEFEIALTDRIIEREQIYQQVESMVIALPHIQRQVIWLRYIEGLTWSKVAMKTHYDRRQCTRIKNRAVQNMSHDVPSICDIV